MEFLSRHGIPFVERNIREDPSALDELIALGSRSTPTIVVDDRVMVGFRKDELLSWVRE